MVCKTRSSDTVLESCGHMSTCYQCALKLGGYCHVCQENLLSTAFSNLKKIEGAAVEFEAKIDGIKRELENCSFLPNTTEIESLSKLILQTWVECVQATAEIEPFAIHPAYCKMELMERWVQMSICRNKIHSSLKNLKCMSFVNETTERKGLFLLL